MANLSGFDANTVEPTSGDVLPAGEYDAIIINSEMKSTQNGDGQYLKLELQILNGPYQNRHLWDNLNLTNPSEKAVQIARGILSAICRAVNVMTPKDSSELHNKPLRIKVAVRKNDEHGEQNKITKYSPRNAGPSQPPAPPPATPILPQPPADPNASPWG